ncbi:TRAP transporter permease [Suttonella ornithocola]|uniref:Neu5Ac permease n=1 Tax=Suttonella ornithocola TaxID=279832 RepID=A0A380MTC1_9GAMM|nr:TRAP transporter fused permease subunit [Suttonella ornithocola]SUO94971.1 Neu5Ac permease [Suttonella ornithocola]
MNPLLLREPSDEHLSRSALILFNILALSLAIFSIANAFYPLVSETQRNMILGMGFAVALAIAYFMWIENAVYARQAAQEPMFTMIGWVAAFVLLVGLLELTRRTTGWVIPILMLISITYLIGWFKWLPEMFRFGGLTMQTVLFRSIYGDDALFGSIASIAATYVFLFIIFGTFLLRAGAGDFVVDLARGIAGRFVGGQGWGAVIASGLTGTISGSAVANTASTGVITIPLMKRAGFPAKFAAGVEAAASTGGQIMPPIMGAGAFVMASTTQIPYEHIVATAFLPAMLYFLSVAMFVRIEAKKQGLQAIKEENIKPLSQAMKEQGASFIIPITLLIILLVKGFTPTYAAVFGIIAIIVSSWFTKTKMGFRACIEALISGSRSMIMMGILLIAVGIIVNMISTVGIGNKFSLMISTWADGNLLIAIVLIALASLILGMGLPVTAAYIVLATVSAPGLRDMMIDAQLVQIIADGTLAEAAKPFFMLADPSIGNVLNAPMSLTDAQALFDKLPADILPGIREQAVDARLAEMALLSAHMIVFWLSQDSNVTPPVCLASFTAAAIAKTPPMATGFESWKLAKGMYIMPVLFAYTPFLSGNFLLSFEVFIFACFGVYALAAAMQGAMERPLSWAWRIPLGIVGILLLYPNDSLRIIGLVRFLILFILHLKYLKLAAPIATQV